MHEWIHLSPQEYYQYYSADFSNQKAPRGTGLISPSSRFRCYPWSLPAFLFQVHWLDFNIKGLGGGGGAERSDSVAVRPGTSESQDLVIKHRDHPTIWETGENITKGLERKTEREYCMEAKFATPKYLCRLFQAENNQGPKDSGRICDLPPIA